MSRILAVDDDRATRHLLSKVLGGAGFAVDTAQDGAEALVKMKATPFDLVLLDVWMPGMNGLEVLNRIRTEAPGSKVVVMTSDNTPETLLGALRGQAHIYINKPIEPKKLIEVVRGALAASASPPIEVLSARPNWVELLVPCQLDVAERIEGFLAHLDADLTDEVRKAIGQVFHEMLANAVEWGGQLDPNRKVRIAYLRAKRMLLYRIADPGSGFRFADLAHAAIGSPSDEPFAHMSVREEKGLRTGGFGILLSQAMVDELLYNEVQNEVVFVKYLD